MSPEEEEKQRPFLSDERVEKIGGIVAPLLRGDMSWIERRKETVVILDDSALRRQVSVDFDLRASVDAVIPATASREGLYCAPVFVLPKSSGNLMAFDLEDEQDRSLRLVSRTDNARISGASLCAMARTILAREGGSLSGALVERLTGLATAQNGRGETMARGLLRASGRATDSDLTTLLADLRFRWWLTTFGHSSLVVVLYRAVEPRRKLVKLSFEEPITSKQRLGAQLGWASYRVVVDSSLIEARSYHFEAQAPPGLRITRARLSDDLDEHEPISASGFLRRVHLYRPAAQRSGAGTAALWLDVSGPGFVGGAFLATTLAFAAVLACRLRMSEIAANPTSAPALLLALTGLLASYIARPDQHALTTRLLAWARRLLMLAAFCAYFAAATVVLSGPTPSTPEALAARVDSLTPWLTGPTLVAALCFAGLAITFGRARLRFLFAQRHMQVEDHRLIARSPHEVFEHLLTTAGPDSLRQRYELVEQDPGARLAFVRLRMGRSWVVSANFAGQDGGTFVSVSAMCFGRLVRTPLAGWLTARESRKIEGSLDACEEWAELSAPER